MFPPANKQYKNHNRKYRVICNKPNVAHVEGKYVYPADIGFYHLELFLCQISEGRKQQYIYNGGQINYGVQNPFASGISVLPAAVQSGA